MAKLSIIIVSYNTRDLLNNCLSSVNKSLLGTDYNNTEIIVIDNGSQDETLDLLEVKYPNVKVIANRENKGFAKACNQGIKIASGDWLLLLNSDTEFYSSDVIGKSLNFAEKIDHIGGVGCKILSIDGRLQPSAGYLPNLINIFAWMSFIDDLPLLNNLLKPYHINNGNFYNKSQRVGWVSGAFLMVKKDVIKSVGLLDEKIFMYGEEVEFCLRLNKAGRQIYYFPDVSIKHLKGASGEGKTAGIVEEFVSLKYLFLKHKPSWQFPFLRLFLHAGALLRILFFGIIKGDSAKYKLYVKAYKVA